MDAGLEAHGMPARRLYDDPQLAALEREARHWRKNHDHVVGLNRALRREASKAIAPVRSTIPLADDYDPRN